MANKKQHLYCCNNSGVFLIIDQMDEAFSTHFLRIFKRNYNIAKEIIIYHHCQHHQYCLDNYNLQLIDPHQHFQPHLNSPFIMIPIYRVPNLLINLIPMIVNPKRVAIVKMIKKCGQPGYTVQDIARVRLLVSCFLSFSLINYFLWLIYVKLKSNLNVFN